MIGALILALTLDAPAPAPTPLPVSRVVAPSPEPLDITPDAPTDPPEIVPSPVPVPPPSPPPVTTPIKAANDRGFHVDTSVGALMTVSGDTGTNIDPTLWIHLDGPIALGNDRSVGRLGMDLGLSTAPGDTAFQIQNIQSWRAVEAGFWGGYVIGSFNGVSTTALVEGYFSSRLKGATTTDVPLQRLSRAAGVGLRFDHADSSSSGTVTLGFDEATSSCDAEFDCTGIHSGLTLRIHGQLALVKEAVLLVGDVSLSLAGAAESGGPVRRRDILRLGLVLDPVQIAKVFNGTR